MQLGGNTELSNLDDSLIDKDEYIKSLEISVQLLQKEIESLREKLLNSKTTNSGSKTDSLYSFTHQFITSNSLEELFEKLNNEIGKQDGIYQASLFHYNSDGFIDTISNSNLDLDLISEVKQLEETGVLDWVYDNQEVKIIPSLSSTINSKNNLLIYPVEIKGDISTLFVARCSIEHSEMNEDLINFIISIAETTSIITDNIISDKEIKSINKKLNDNKKNISINDYSKLVSSISSELVSPIEIIKANLSFIKTGIGDSPKRAEISQTELAKLESLILKLNSLFNDSSIKGFHLNTILEDIKILTRSQLLREGIKFSYVQDSSNPYISIDPKLFEQIILILLFTSSELIEDGGTIRLSYSFNNENLTISLVDSGLGFTSEEINEIYNEDSPSLLKNKIFNNMKNVISMCKENSISFEIVSDSGLGNGFKLVILAGKIDE